MKNGFKEVLKIGLRNVVYNYRFLILLWATNFLFSVVLSLPVFILLKDNLSHSLLNDRIIPGLDFTWFLQFRHLNQQAMDSILILVISIAGIYTIIQTFFMGGLVAVFITPQKNHLLDFFYGGVKYWYRFMKVTLAAVVLYAMIFTLYEYIEDLITWALIDVNYIWMDLIFRSVNFLFLIFLIGIVIMLSDYTKIALAVKSKFKTTKELIGAVKFIRWNFYQVFGTFLSIAVLAACGAVFYNLLDTLFPRTPFYFLILSFILQQMLIIFRLLMRMLFAATEVYLYKDLNAEIVENNEVLEVPGE